MIAVLPTVLTVAALIGAAWALVLLIADRLPGRPLLAYLALLEVAVLAQAVIGLVNLVGTDRPIERATFAGYLVGSLLILPIAAYLALAERSRWACGVLLVACLTVPVMIVRMNQLWAGPGG